MDNNQVTRKPATMGFFFFGYMQALIHAGIHEDESVIEKTRGNTRTPHRDSTVALPREKEKGPYRAPFFISLQIWS